MNDGATTKSPKQRWTKAHEQAFLECLAATCNVSQACRDAGVSFRTAYGRRAKRPDFAQAWRAAILTGYDMLESQLLERAGAAVEAAASGDAFDADLAIRMLGIHQNRMKTQANGTQKLQSRVRRATQAETDAAILRHLAALKRRLERDAGKQVEAMAGAGA